jgi:hypothetical protein
MTACHRSRVALATAALAIVAPLAAAPTASAYNYRNVSAGGVCHGANGANSKFTFNLQYLTNVGNTDQYVVCNLGNDDLGSFTGPVKLATYLRLPTAGTTVTCIAQVGYWADGVTTVRSSSALSWTTTTPNEGVLLQWDAAKLTRYQHYEIPMFNCKLPPGAQMGLIEYWLVDPA